MWLYSTLLPQWLWVLAKSLHLASSWRTRFVKCCMCVNIVSVSVLREPFRFSSSGTLSAGHREESQGAAGAGEEDGWNGSLENAAAGGGQAAGGAAAKGGAGQAAERTGNRLGSTCTARPWLISVVLSGGAGASYSTSTWQPNEGQQYSLPRTPRKSASASSCYFFSPFFFFFFRYLPGTWVCSQYILFL